MLVNQYLITKKKGEPLPSDTKSSSETKTTGESLSEIDRFYFIKELQQVLNARKNERQLRIENKLKIA